MGTWGQIWVEGIEFGVFGDLDLGCLGALGEETLGIWGVVGSVERVWGPNGAGLGCLGIWGLIWVEGNRFGVFGDLGGKFRVFWRCMGEERLGSKGSRVGVFGV